MKKLKELNGKPIVSDKQIETVTNLVKKGVPIAEAGRAAGLRTYSVAWRIANGNYNPENRKVVKEKKRSRFFEHDEYYRF